MLLTPGIAPSEDTEIEHVRYSTARLRKLVATGEDLATPADVERVLRPLLPLVGDRMALRSESALDVLPRLLRRQEIPESVTNLLIDAFLKQDALLERLHQAQGES